MGDEALVRRFEGTVRRLRSEQGYSQEGFALKVGLHQTYIANVERGEKAVTIVTANKLARALGLTLTVLFAELERTAEDGAHRPPAP
jgi:transcriptional regulator with XRE-family HTH domain